MYSVNQQLIVYELFSGINKAEVAHKYGITVKQTETILLQYHSSFSSQRIGFKCRQSIQLYQKLQRIPSLPELKKILPNEKSRKFYLKLLRKYQADIQASYNNLPVADKNKNVVTTLLLVKEIKEIYNRLGYVPSQDEYQSLTHYESNALLSLFNSYEKLIKKTFGTIVLKQFAHKRRMEDLRKKMIVYLLQKTKAQGRTPEAKELRNDTTYNYSQYKHVFGSYMKALYMAELEPNVPNIY